MIFQKKKAVTVELDYKGTYSRFALTEKAFCEKFNLKATEKGNSHTIRPMVHIYYKLTEVNSEYWNRFFKDMTYELPISDLENNNLAVVDLNTTSRCFIKNI